MRGTMVLVDTSIFISHFRGMNVPDFVELVSNDQVLLSPYVKLELLQGVRKSELPQVKYALEGLPPSPHSPRIFQECERILSLVKPAGLMLGVVDLLLAAEANLLKCPVYSQDKIFDKLAKLRLVAVL